jgi:hypothetical protein
MDHLGCGKQQKRTIFLNRFKCDIDHIFTLALHLSTAFTKKQLRGHKLFPGSASSQSGCAADI